ncbi:hypothetical protein KVR01_012262 [Diaporthe batatas]|uniref:uncharacterized protein n=1 Tax=Diaporthe batatas TaxID=748121 RepID=UPI001D036F6A|nr:uncharacterized protein KVR01_012262 [Diaporthe batatas]KAG8157990.1 hypothetical protein KVR01_012262 [Diaporthe batatas]
MMELRPIQAALLAGRAASRRAAAGPSPLSHPLAAPSFYRCFSSTRPSLSEAEAAAPPPTPSMQEWSRQQQQKQPQQPAQPAWGRPAGTSPGASAGLASLLQPTAPPSTQPSSTTTTTTTTPTTAAAPAPARSPWASPSSPALRHAQEKRLAARQRPTLTDDLMGELGLTIGSGPTSEDLLMTGLRLSNEEPIANVKYRLRPSVGRTVHLVKDKVDLARGLALLNLRVRTNKVSQDVSRQRFHERPGLKRKRLRRERWRTNFKEGFKATCKRVTELARQGW